MGDDVSTKGYRIPREGTNNYSRAVAKAVDDVGWQRFRVSMKGKTTQVKLAMLLDYWSDPRQEDREVVDLRVLNYLKALSRGGQIAVPQDWDYLSHLVRGDLEVKK